MPSSRVDVREQGANGAASAFAASVGAALLRRAGRAPAVAPEVGASRSWWKGVARLARNAVAAVAIMTLVPTVLVLVQGDSLARMLYRSHDNTFTRVAAADRVRPFRLPADPSITPMQAGLALNRLQPSRATSPGFELLAPDGQIVLPWRSMSISPDMFVSARPSLYEGPSSQAILEAAARGFSPNERAYLEAVSASPVWRDFDLVARAPAVDIVGGRFRIPFGADALPEQRPIPSFKTSRELSYAAVARAAHYMAIGQRDSAETVLRSIVSYGFAIMDNGSTSLEGLIGGVIVGVGRDALQRFYLIQHDPRASSSALAPPPKSGVSAARSGTALSAEELRRQLLARIEDPAVPLTERFDGLQSLSISSCTNVRELLFGPRSDVADVLGRAERTLARYPSERALVNLQTRLPSLSSGYGTLNPFQALAASSASVAGVVTRNPRLVTCTRVLTGGW
jgi:hypothetical protein